MKKRLGKPAEERWSVRTRRVRQRTGNAGTTTHVIEPTVDARFVRLNVSRPSYSGEPVARIYEFEVYGPDGKVNLALNRPATGSQPCSPDQGPEKAVNGSVAGGQADRWCADDWPLFLQVDLGAARPVTRFVVKHASAGGENEESDTRDFNIQLSNDGKSFTTVASSSGAGFVDERTEYRADRLLRRAAGGPAPCSSTASWRAGTSTACSTSKRIGRSSRGSSSTSTCGSRSSSAVSASSCISSAGEMSNRTLHFWFLAPARREVLLAGKYAAGLIASAVIFGGGALLTLAAMIWPHDAVEVQAYWNAGGMGHVFWYAAAAVLGCVGYGSVFLAVGLYVRNPIIPAAVLLAWEGVNGILPHVLQKMSILYYLQSLCPVPAPMEDDAPMLIRLLAAPAAPASRPGAILGLLLLTAFVLWIASLAVRRMQISYGAET